MSESELQRAYIYPKYPKNFKIYSDKAFVNVDNGPEGGTHWTCFIVTNNISYYLDSLGGQPDTFFLDQIINQQYIINMKPKI